MNDGDSNGRRNRGSDRILNRVLDRGSGELSQELCELILLRSFFEQKPVKFRFVVGLDMVFHTSRVFKPPRT